MVNIIRVRAVSQGWTGGPGLSTYYYQGAGGAEPTADDVSAAVARVHLAYEQNKALWWNGWSVNISNACDILDAATGELVGTLTGIAVATVNGSTSTNVGATPLGLCLGLVTNTFIGGHRVRGRSFMVPLAPAGDSDGSPTAVQIGLADNFGAVLRAFGLGPPEFVVWHRPVNKLGGAVAPVVAVAIKDKWAVLRSRRD